jgi:hypothetical protein
MKKLRIGYFGYSSDFSHPADRRRIVFWAKDRGHQLLANESNNVDLIVLSERADLRFLEKYDVNIPIVFDLIDAYFIHDKFKNDLLRGTLKVTTKQISGLPNRFSSMVKNLAYNVSGVICSSNEQKEIIQNKFSNVHVILDSHDELPLLKFRDKLTNNLPGILWEGMAATIPALKQLKQPLSLSQRNEKLRVNVVTDMEYFRLLGKYFPASSEALLQKVLGSVSRQVKLTPWTIPNLVKKASESHLSVLPVNMHSQLHALKPENRLLIMWRLGLPCLTSATPSYLRVARETGLNYICINQTEWLEKMDEVLADESLAEHIVYSGQKYLEANHNRDFLLTKWDTAIGSVL